MENYKTLHNQRVGLVVEARISSGSYGQAGSSLSLEGTLDSETDSQVKFTDAKTTHKYNPQFETPQMYVNKDKIVLLYALKK